MFYYFFDYLQTTYDLSGAGLFQYISFRALIAAVSALLTSIILGKCVINYLKKKQIGETIRHLGLQDENAKSGTPTMGGIIIIISGILPILLFTKFSNVYVLLLLFGLVWTGLVGFLDDYIKVFKKNKKGLPGKIKILAQVVLGSIIGLTLYFNSHVLIREFEPIPARQVTVDKNKQNLTISTITRDYKDTKSLITTIPFFKNNRLDYGNMPFMNQNSPFIPIIYIFVVVFIITAVSNGSNLTDGLDGLAIGVSLIIIAVFGLLAYLSGNYIFAEYLKIMYIPHISEVVICCSALVGACLGFMWYNTYPAQIFMGDVGSLTLGSFIAILAVIMRKELMLPLLCGVFFIESLSVILQVGYFKYTKKRFGNGKRIFKMAPIHHHFQKAGFHESKIVVRFWILTCLLAILAVLSLKIR